MKQYKAQNGDRLDTIVYKEYKTLKKEVLNKVIEENPKLMTKPVLEDGDIVFLPLIELPKEQLKEVKTLW